MSVVHLENDGPMGPGIAGGPGLRGLRHELQVDDRLRTLTHCSANAVVPGVSTSNDNDFPVLGIQSLGVRTVLFGSPPTAPLAADITSIQQLLGVVREIVHRQVDSVQVASWHSLHVSGHGGAHRQQNRIVLLEELGRPGASVGAFDAALLGALRNTASCTRDEGDTFLLHDAHTSLHHIHLVGLHVGHAVHHKASNAVRTLQDSDAMAHLVELVSSRQATRPRAHNDHPLVRADGWRGWLHPAHLVGLVDDGQLHRLDADRVINDAQGAGTFAGRGANAASELREVVSGHKALEGIVPGALAHKVIPLWNQVAQGAPRFVGDALVAERRSAVHASCSLRLHLHLILLRQNFLEVCHAL
mmetsp:Transcript_89151/g.212859  ORF Transcript_89151/g.212859 Transcript_89151/m.212859 type:complete len:359 (-) Transcript_89151:5105-6181(-)